MHRTLNDTPGKIALPAKAKEKTAEAVGSVEGRERLRDTTSYSDNTDVTLRLPLVQFEAPYDHRCSVMVCCDVVWSDLAFEQAMLQDTAGSNSVAGQDWG